MTKYFEFTQNNYGGSFVIDDVRGLGPRVWIEAKNADDANSRAEGIGIYFNGCEDDIDCDCCGDRWYPVYKDDGEEEVNINYKYDFNCHDTIYIHHVDGQISRIKNDEKV